MIYYAFLAQIIPIFFYFIGRGNNELTVQGVLEKMKLPLVFAIICGIIFFFSPPAWYMQMKMEQTRAYSTDYSLMGIFRLSSFWGHPYQIGYATLLFLLYLLCQIIRDDFNMNHKKIQNYAHIALCVICLLLAQLRVTIAVALLVLTYDILLLKKDSIGNLMKYVLITVSVIGCGLIYILLSDNEISTYIVEHTFALFSQEEYTYRFEHTAGGITNYTMFGDGFGRYGFIARNHNAWALVDHEFQRQTAELGYIGLSLLILILSLTLINCILKQECVLETGIFIFYVTAMFGASILSNEHQYNFIFWFCLGKIWSHKYQSRKILI